MLICCALSYLGSTVKISLESLKTLKKPNLRNNPAFTRGMIVFCVVGCAKPKNVPLFI